MASFQAHISFRLIAIAFGLVSARDITKQAIAKRMTDRCVEFMRHALFVTMARLSTFHKHHEDGLFQSFSRVLIQDSTQLSLPLHLAVLFPGPANQNRKKSAALKIQAVYDLLGECFPHFSLSGFTRTDQSASPDILDIAKSGDLVLRDLGYFATPVFQKMIDQGIHFLSRLRHDVSIYDPQTLKPIDLVTQLRRCPGLDRNVLLSAKQRVMVRMVALPVPEHIANERRRKAKSRRDTRYTLSKRHLDLLGWNIFVTSVAPCTWSTEAVQKAYWLRWRIEIIFKTWKSHFHLTETPNGSANQLKVLIYSRLIAICLFQNMFGVLELYISKPVSLLKLAQLFPWLLILSLMGSIPAGLRIELLQKHLQLEKREKYSSDLTSLPLS